jgi:Secretion system C-terminal sorting domain
MLKKWNEIWGINLKLLKYLIMKKLILCLSILIGGINTSFSQCTPNPLYATEDWGFWPLLDGLPNATIDVLYAQVIDFKLPTNTNVIDPELDFVITSAVLDSVTGLPVGIDWQCNAADCTYDGGEQGCATLSGVTAGPIGVYPLKIYITIITNVFGFPVPLPYTDTTFSLTVDGAIGINEEVKKNFSVLQNSPNPAKDITKIKYALPSNTLVELSVFDLVGKKVKSEKFFAEKGEKEYILNTSAMEAGIYMYSVKAYDKVITKRMNVIK